MKTKNIFAILTIISFFLYFLPFKPVKFFSTLFILLFSPGYFVLNIYKDVKKEEYFLVPVISLGISGIVAIILSSLSILSSKNMLITLGVIILIAYILSKPGKVDTISEKKEMKAITVLVILMLITAGVWLIKEFSTNPKKEVDIAIQKWPLNASTNTTLLFVIYVKNWYYPGENFTVVFSLNNRIMENRSFSLPPGESKYLYFNAITHSVGKNLASFDLYIDGKYYTNVHIYFEVSS